MSETLLKFAISFVNGRLTAEKFADAYQEIWKIERDSDLLIKDEDDLSECLSTIFCLADSYNLNEARMEGEMDETMTRKEIEQVISIYNAKKEDGVKMGLR